MPETALAPTAEGSSGAAGRAVRQALASGSAALTDAGCETPRLDAELLLCAALGEGWSRARLVTADREWLDAGVLQRYGQLLARRRVREPVAYIVGFKNFRRITLAVDSRVLIPRPETELLVDVGLTLPRRATVADIGTGSGAVALALKQERPDLEVTGVEVSADALAVARENARRLKLDVRFVQADLLDHDGYDAVLSNPPYVPARAGGLAPEITRYEPREALYGGADGLDLIRRLIDRVDGVPLVALEVGTAQAPTVAALLDSRGFGSVERLRDLAGHERVVIACR